MTKGLVKEKEKSSQLIELKVLKNPIFVYILLAFALGAIVFGVMLLLGDFSSSFNTPQLGSEGCIAQLDIKGEIVSYEIEPDIFGQTSSLTSSLEVKRLIEEADKKSNIKGILIVIDSPGGSVLGSQEIYKALKNSKKPKVAYLREIAASGGYYAALGTDYIIAEPSTLTGSIGARMTLIELTDLFQKIGYNQTNIKSGELKDIGDPSKKPTEKEIQLLQNLVNETFEDFKQALLINRANKLDQNKLEDIYSAAIFSGKQAFEIGLVDQIGEKEDAINKISELAKSKKKLLICESEKRKGGFLSSLLNSFTQILSPKVQINVNIAKPSSTKSLFYE
ncbi:MAG: signal peptide peptidase SppA [Candidatus Anstonellaceae archaeon]